MTRFGIWMIAATLSGSAAAAEGGSVTVGGDSVSGRQLQPYENAWLYTAKYPDGRVKTQGIWSDHVELATIDGRQALKRVQGMTYVNALTSSGITVMDAATCAPISSEQHRPDGLVIKRSFSGARVVTDRGPRDNEGARQTTVEFPAPVFDYYGGAYGLLLSCFPLKVGYSAEFPAIGETDDVSDPVNFKVVRREKIAAGHRGLVDTYVVTAEKAGEYLQTFWLSKTAPYIIRLEITYPDKPYVASFEMI